MLLNVTAVGIIGFIELHKIAGPIYRLTKTVRQVTGGDYTAQFRLRARDFPQKLASSFRDMVGDLRRKTEADLGKLDEIDRQAKLITGEIERERLDKTKVQTAGKEIERIIAAMHAERVRTLESKP